MGQTEAYFAHSRPELKRFIPAQYKNVLEIGCGEGAFRENLAKEAAVWGIEPNPNAAKTAQQRLDQVLVGTFEEVKDQLPAELFNLVICNDVIEHMSDDYGFLVDIQRKMAPGGYIMGSIPNIRHWQELKSLVFKKEWQYTDEGILDRTHLRFYTVKSFPLLLQKAGFEMIRFEGINNSFSRKPHKRLLFSLFGGLLSDVGFLQFAFLARVVRNA